MHRRDERRRDRALEFWYGVRLKSGLREEAASRTASPVKLLPHAILRPRRGFRFRRIAIFRARHG